MGFKGLCAEWIGGRIAGLLELPIPEIEIVEIPPELLALLNEEDQRDLGKGPAFASKELVPSEDFLYSQFESVCPILKGRILLFDWWTCNCDRILGSLGGNPNMLWSGTPRQLFIIDHNQTFSPDS
jgi:hypothetical protein